MLDGRRYVENYASSCHFYGQEWKGAFSYEFSLRQYGLNGSPLASGMQAWRPTPSSGRTDRGERRHEVDDSRLSSVFS